MKLTVDYILSEDGGVPDVFYKATAGGVQTCYIVESPWMDDETGDSVTGYVVDNLFIKIRTDVNSDLTHFDNLANQGFFTTEQEAISYHRELVLNYINGLNASSLKTCPIVAG